MKLELIHAGLAAAGIPVTGVAIMEGGVHPSDQPAAFVKAAAGLYRVDLTAPVTDEALTAAFVELGLGPVDYIEQFFSF